MRTILDEGETWFLRGIVYDRELRLIVVEMSVSPDAEEVSVAGRSLGELHRYEVTEMEADRPAFLNSCDHALQLRA